MTALRFALFDTAIGHIGIVWGDRGVVGVHLPADSALATRARITLRHPGAIDGSPPAPVQRTIEGIGALLRGEASDLAAVELDMTDVSPFYRRVYEAARAIAPGATLSYGEIAARIGSPGSARAVGQALGRNPFAIVVPCHRVLAAGGKAGGFSAAGGVTTKLRLLALEGAAAGAGALFEGDGAFGFDPIAAVEHLRASDPALARLVESVGPFRMQLARTQSLFVALAQAIVYQQLNGKAAATIFARLCALFPQPHAGPTPEQILRASDEKLRGAGVSRSKLLSLRDLAEKTSQGTIPTLAEVHRLDSEAVIERLTAVRGIGRWTVEMLLMFRLGRPDVLPIDDYGIRKGFAITFGKREMPTREDLERRGARWKPYRTVASWYLWRAVERAKSAEPPPKRADRRPGAPAARRASP
jgi:O-6-methylguanine DNA methyltransferase